jgi:hypothetical protein
MSEERTPGTPVPSDYTPVEIRNELDPLIEFLTGAFRRESEQIYELTRLAASDPDRAVLHRLGGRALAFRQLLGHWEAHARRLWKSRYATQLDLTRDEHAESKRSAREIEALAEQPILSLRETLERIQAERDEMTEIARWAREQTRSITGDEISGEAAGNPDIGEDFYVPAFDAGITSLR